MQPAKYSTRTKQRNLVQNSRPVALDCNQSSAGDTEPAEESNGPDIDYRDQLLV